MQPTDVYSGAFRLVPVELVIATNTVTYNFPDKSMFRKRYKIFGFSHRAYNATRKTESGKSLPADAVLKSSHIKLVKGSTDEVMSLPLETVIEDLTGYKVGFFFNPIEADFSNSKIVMADSSLVAGNVGAAFELMVYVTDESLSC